MKEANWFGFALGTVLIAAVGGLSSLILGPTLGPAFGFLIGLMGGSFLYFATLSPYR